MNSVRQILRPDAVHQVEVGRDDSGGVRLRIGAVGIVMSPDDAIKMGSAILQAAGCNVAFDNPVRQ